MFWAFKMLGSNFVRCGRWGNIAWFYFYTPPKCVYYAESSITFYKESLLLFYSWTDRCKGGGLTPIEDWEIPVVFVVISKLSSDWPTLLLIYFLLKDKRLKGLPSSLSACLISVLDWYVFLLLLSIASPSWLLSALPFTEFIYSGLLTARIGDALPACRSADVNFWLALFVYWLSNLSLDLVILPFRSFFKFYI